MSAVERDLEAYEDMRRELTEIAISTGAIKLNEDGETLTCSNGDAERHSYALATGRFKKGAWRCSIEEVRETLRSILDEARWGDRHVERYQYTF
ncbi:MAG TPA: hypothetical protein VGD54_11170 [Steroidobacteraceae bacterium]